MTSSSDPTENRGGRSTRTAYLLYAASVALGAGSLLVLVFFLYGGPLHIVELELGTAATLGLDTALCLVFFLQHSGMVRTGFRRRLSRFVREEFQAAVYSIASGVVLLALIGFWQQSEEQWVTVHGMARWILRGSFFLALAGFVWGSRALGPFDGLGLRAIVRYVRAKPARQMSFAVRGPYRWVRHPLYFFALVLFWSYPDLTADRLLFNVLWTSWVVVGARLEERDLVAVFGEPYREYQRLVPMLVPLRLRPVDIPEQA
jgi:protein-S-isoprenylcysteine O-methyltransferase Ste14